jgi:PPE-repeat protein
MTRRHGTALPVLTGVLAMLCARRAFADAPSCASIAIEADASVNTRWPTLIGRVRDAFEARDDIDRCARVALTLHGAAITVAAVLPDGRSAARSVSRQDDVVPTLEALLLVPERSALAVSHPVAQAQTAAVEPSVSGRPPPNAVSTAPPATSPPATRVAPSPRLAVRDRDASSPTPGPSPSHLRIELSVITGGRIGDGQVSLGLGASSLLDLSGWLVGFEGRADRYKTLAPGWPEASVLELAAFGGRRIRFRTIALDVIAGPALVLQGTTTFTTATTGGNEGTGSSSSTAPRLLLGARVNFGALSVLRTFVGVDGELGPSRLGDGGDFPAVPRLPVWTLGLALGGTVGTL